jgi:predicted TPR repeat methyltransferase
MTEKYFPRAYNLTSQAEIDDLYNAWAASYDEEVIAEGYETPARVAAALAKFAPNDAKILDIGCGTGYSGVHLSAAGFINLTGSDPNPNMLKLARSRNLYAHVLETDLSNPYPFEPGTYDVITARGVIGSGAAPATVLEPTLNALAPNGLLAFSFNDAALAMPEYTNVLGSVLDRKVAEQVFKEHGAHLTNKDIGSNVYVLRKT